MLWIAIKRYNSGPQIPCISSSNTDVFNIAFRRAHGHCILSQVHRGMDLDVVHQRLDRIQWHYCSICHHCLLEYPGVWNCVYFPPTGETDANLDP